MSNQTTTFSFLAREIFFFAEIDWGHNNLSIIPIKGMKASSSRDSLTWDTKVEVIIRVKEPV